MSSFYDDDWKRLLRQHPLIARKIEDLRCETVSYEEFEELRRRFEHLEIWRHRKSSTARKILTNFFGRIFKALRTLSREPANNSN